jgi:hypothetical protein
VLLQARPAGEHPFEAPTRFGSRSSAAAAAAAAAASRRPQPTCSTGANFSGKSVYIKHCSSRRVGQGGEVIVTP